jgi:hypothetical protein
MGLRCQPLCTRNLKVIAIVGYLPFFDPFRLILPFKRWGHAGWWIPYVNFHVVQETCDISIFLPVILWNTCLFYSFRFILSFQHWGILWLMGPSCQPLCTGNLRYLNFFTRDIARYLPFLRPLTFNFIHCYNFEARCWPMDPSCQPLCKRKLKYLDFLPVILRDSSPFLFYSV